LGTNDTEKPPELPEFANMSAVSRAFQLGRPRHKWQGEIEYMYGRVSIEVSIFRWGCALLTEQEVTRSWSRLVKSGINPDTLAKMEALLDELRAESPLYHRLSAELDELRGLSLT
jgi:hypothetical protein